ncbi:hypothetical protein [Paenibacillus silvisoli]|uniref:hypothetical protein n=1 Tax=Paenibacillus silvisoli TaxID=3110539 RepID=UPI00280523E4|nr:hypothetical protein [Paenibacillus silvisoli]
MQSLMMRSDAAYTLNYLIYIQNAYLNKRESDQDERYRFPYMPSLELAFAEEFEASFAKVWNEAAARIAEHFLNDLKLFTTHEKFVYERLFAQSEHNLKAYNDFYLAFRAWWDSYAGRLALDHTFDAQKIYAALSSVVKAVGSEPVKPFEVSIVYDAPVLGSEERHSYFAVMTIADGFTREHELERRIKSWFE